MKTYQVKLFIYSYLLACSVALAGFEYLSDTQILELSAKDRALYSRQLKAFEEAQWKSGRNPVDPRYVLQTWVSGRGDTAEERESLESRLVQKYLSEIQNPTLIIGCGHFLGHHFASHFTTSIGNHSHPLALTMDSFAYLNYYLPEIAHNLAPPEVLQSKERIYGTDIHRSILDDLPKGMRGQFQTVYGELITHHVLQNPISLMNMTLALRDQGQLVADFIDLNGPYTLIYKIELSPEYEAQFNILNANEVMLESQSQLELFSVIHKVERILGPFFKASDVEIAKKTAFFIAQSLVDLGYTNISFELGKNPFNDRPSSGYILGTRNHSYLSTENLEEMPALKQLSEQTDWVDLLRKLRAHK